MSPLLSKQQRATLCVLKIYKPVLRGITRSMLCGWDQLSFATFGFFTPEIGESQHYIPKDTILENIAATNRGAAARHRWRERQNYYESIEPCQFSSPVLPPKPFSSIRENRAQKPNQRKIENLLRLHRKYLISTIYKSWGFCTEDSETQNLGFQKPLELQDPKFINKIAKRKSSSFTYFNVTEFVFSLSKVLEKESIRKQFLAFNCLRRNMISSVSVKFSPETDMKFPVVSLKTSMLVDRVCQKMERIVIARKVWSFWREKALLSVKFGKLGEIFHRITSSRKAFVFILLQLHSEQQETIDLLREIKRCVGRLERKNKKNFEANKFSSKFLLTANYCQINDGLLNNGLVLQDDYPSITKKNDKTSFSLRSLIQNLESSYDIQKKLDQSLATDLSKSKPESILEIPFEETCNIPSHSIKQPSIPKKVTFEEVVSELTKVSVGKLLAGFRVWLLSETTELDCVLKLLGSELIWVPYSRKALDFDRSYSAQTKAVNAWVKNFMISTGSREEPPERGVGRFSFPRFRSRSSSRKNQIQKDGKIQKVSISNTRRPLYAWRHNCRDPSRRLLLPIEECGNKFQFLSIAVDSGQELLPLLSSLTGVICFSQLFNIDQDKNGIFELRISQKPVSSPVLQKIVDWESFGYWIRQERLKWLFRLIRRKVRVQRYQIQ